MEFIKLKIKEVREAHGMSLSELSRRSGISKSYLSQLESGKFSDPSVFKLIKIATILGVDILDLVEDWLFHQTCEVVQKTELKHTKKTFNHLPPAQREG